MMNINQDVKIGEWFCAEEGIAIAENLHHFYYEEYDIIPEDKKIGDYNLSMMEYKLFCDYDGKPIRRNRFKYLRSSYCLPLDKQYKKVLEESIKNNPKEYASFEKFLKVPKETYELCIKFFEIPEGSEKDAARVFEIIQQSLPQMFTYEEVLKIAADNHCVADLTKPLPDTICIPEYVEIYMWYAYGDFRGKRVLFHSFQYKVCDRRKSDWYQSPDIH